MNNLEKNSDVSKLMDKGRKKQAETNRKLLGSIVKVVVFCGKQNIPLRGDRDDGYIEIYDEECTLEDIS